MIITTHCVRLLAAFVAASALFVLPANVASALDFPGPDPGPARAAIQGDTITLENNVLRFTWSTAGGHLRPKEFVDKLNGKTLSLAGSECFQIVLDDSPSLNPLVVKASQWEIEGKPEVVDLASGTVWNRHFPLGGKRITVNFKGDYSSVWDADLFDEANYVRQSAFANALQMREIVLWDFAAPDTRPCGEVDGCPLISGTIFVASENPLAKGEVFQPKQSGSNANRLQIQLPRAAAHPPDYNIDVLWVIGVVPARQMRRGFLYYLERERARPYRPFLHYNNGSEIGCEYWAKRLHKSNAEAEQFRMKQQELWLNNIRAIGSELVKKRNVKIDAFVHDFEWDDESLVWQFHRGYPKGFAPAAAVAEKGAKIGVWFSPWGGYPGQPTRVASGRKMGFETNPMGLSLAGPRYYGRVSTACKNMVSVWGANYFKFDGFGAGNNQQGAGPYISDLEALLTLADELRATEREIRRYDPFPIFINATTGSWPSPFWLLYVDSIWRQGNDTGMLGKGPDRQRWITYRDNEVYHRIVKRSPLFPLNSLMIHGVFVNKLPLAGNPYDPKNPPASVVPKDVIDEIHTFFATGTDCQELYVNPKLMTAELWDALAEAAKWSRRNSDVLVDTHWIGGDPAKGEIYGYASWSKRQGIFSLRNPDDKPARIALDVGQAFELPAGAPTRYRLRSPWKRDAARPAIEVAAGKPHTFSLAPFEALAFDAVPVQAGK